MVNGLKHCWNLHNSKFKFFLRIWNLDQILNIFKKEDDPQSLCIFKDTDYDRRG